jgi:hypothetical protein
VSERDDDLGAAFRALRAPGSTAGYRDRVPSVDAVGAVHAPRWPQALAGALAVVVALAGAGTFLALRNARQQGGAAGAGYPAARENAAMAFDSTSGRTVMYGGISSTGTPLNDTWTWDGSSWSQLSTASPGALSSARMSDDPADGGVLLMGVLLPSNPGVVSGGCAVSSSGVGVGTVVPNSATGVTTAPSGQATVPPSSGRSLPAVPPVNPPPALTAQPVATLPPSPVPYQTLPSCPTPAPSPPLQTWLLTGKGWTQLASTSTYGTDTPGIGSQMAYDSTTREVVAVSPGSSICIEGGPLRAGAQPQVLCPLVGAAQPGAASGSSALAPPCPATAGNTMCPAFVPSLTTWTWSHGRWARRGGAILAGVYGGTLVSDSASTHVTMVVEVSSPQPGCTGTSPPTCPEAPPGFAVYAWAGSAWSASTVTTATSAAFSLAGAAVASAGGHALAVNSSGVYAWSSSQSPWSLQATTPQPDPRAGAAMAEGPHGSIVLFGGTRGGAGFFSGYAPAGAGPALGSDTWTWDGSAWRHLAGAVPPSPPAPTFCADNSSPKNPCIQPAPVPVMPGAPAPALGAPGSAAPAIAPAPSSPSPT